MEVDRRKGHADMTLLRLLDWSHEQSEQVGRVGVKMYVDDGVIKMCRCQMWVTSRQGELVARFV